MTVFTVSLGEIIRWMLKGFFICCTVAVMISRFGPGNGQVLLRYGKVGQLKNKNDYDDSNKRQILVSRVWNQINKGLASWTVPKSWFTHFYILSTCLWGFTFLQFITLKGLVKYIRFTDCQVQIEGLTKLKFVSPSTTNDEVLTSSNYGNWDALQIWTVSIFFMTQSLRRCYETTFVSKHSPNSKMLLGHYLVGMGFYLADCLMVWTDGSRAIFQQASRHGSSHGFAHFFPKSLRTYRLAWIAFIAANIYQSWSHAYLASLKKYTIPSKGLFKSVACPHYLCEIIIYLACYSVWPTDITFCMMTWIICNLAVSAEQSRLFYESDTSNTAKSPPPPRYALVPLIW